LPYLRLGDPHVKMLRHYPQDFSVLIRIDLVEVLFLEVLQSELPQGTGLTVCTLQNIIDVDVVVAIGVERTKCKLLNEVRVALGDEGQVGLSIGSNRHLETILLLYCI